MRSFVLSLLAVFLAISFCHAQVPSTSPFNGVAPATFNTAGGSYDNTASYYRFEWSFGELLLVQSFAPPDSSVLVTQGILQPCTDDITPFPQTLLFESGDYRLFPNPTKGPFEVNFFVRTVGKMSLQLIDAAGRLLSKRSFHYDGCCRIEIFDLTKYPDGVYYIIADLKPDGAGNNSFEATRHGGLKVIKLMGN